MAIIALAGSIQAARAEENLPGFMSMDSVPGHRHAMAIKATPHFFSIGPRGKTDVKRSDTRNPAPVKAAIPAMSKITMPVKQADATPIPSARTLAKSSSPKGMTEEKARQLLSIFPTVE